MDRGKNKIKVAVGLSGGVDSAVSAYLLKEKGYDVVGVNLICWDEGPHCRAREDRKDALAVALKLGIPFEVLDFQKEYKERVIDRFYKDYEKGLTPNPDVWCNSEIKFGLFLDWAVKNGFDYVATGHYARVRRRNLRSYESTNLGEKKVGDKKVYSLEQPEDKTKDQSYFLYQLGQEELSKVMFPLGEIKKSEVRKIAKKAGLPVADKPDSQGICFIGDIDVQEFLRRRLKEESGEVVDSKGEVIGTHKGVWFYTIGQRGGWEPKAAYQKKFGGQLPVFYVIEKDVENNRLVVGFGAEGYKDQFQIRDLKLIGSQIIDHRSSIKVRIRNTGELIRSRIKDYRSGSLIVELEEPQKGVAPGQAAVFYKDGVCVGGGVIE